jgi:uncharacterized membrane protein YhfC
MYARRGPGPARRRDRQAARRRNASLVLAVVLAALFDLEAGIYLQSSTNQAAAAAE